MPGKSTNSELERRIAHLEKALDAQNKELRVLKRLVDRSQDVIYHYNIQSKTFTLYNRTGFELYGESNAKELSSKMVLSRIHPQDRHKVKKAAKESLAAGNIGGEVEYRQQHADGTIRRMHDKWSVVRDPNAQPVAIEGIVRDITQRRQAQYASRVSEEKYRKIFQYHSAVKLLVDPSTGNIVEANEAAERYYGWSAAHLQKMRIQDINTLPSDRVEAEIEKVRSQKSNYFEFRHRLADGSIRDVEVYSNCIEIDGKQLLHSIIHDISERKKAQEKLRESEHKFRRVYEHTGVGIAQISLGFTIDHANKAYCRMLGYREDELVGKHLKDITVPEILEENLRLQTQLLHGEIHHYQMEKQFKHKDGHTVYGILDANTIHDGSGKPLYFLGSVLDISELKKSEEKRQELQEQLNQKHKLESVGRLAGGVAHDFNNMLSVILGHAEMALEHVAENQPLYTNLKEIQQAAQHSADVTRKLLAFARKQPIAPKVLDLNETVYGMLQMLRRLIGEGIDLVWQPGKNLWPVRMDASQLDQILADLCVNARDAISGRGKITIETGNVTFDKDYSAAHADFVPGDFVLMAVSDDGCGMEKEILQNLFEPFFTTKDVDKGTGLGLATVYGIVRQNHGFVNVFSDPDQGTTFKLYFPRHETKSESIFEKDPVSLKTPGNETILLVEDEKAILEMTAKMIELLGYTVLPASTPGGAVRICREHGSEIHMLMTDVVMPDMNGRDLAEILLHLRPNIKRLFMSGYTADVIANHGVLEEGVHFIQKPFGMNDLATKLREVLDA